MTIDPIERAVIAGACRALTRRANALRKHAADLTTVIDYHGRTIPIAAPESTVALSTAALFDQCAAHLAPDPVLLAGHSGAAL